MSVSAPTRRADMTWSVSASGHHKTETWRDEEYELLRALVESVDEDASVATTSFTFTGNHVSATSLDDAKAKLNAYDTEEDEPATTESETKET
jgi:hypothetical protein